MDAWSDVAALRPVAAGLVQFGTFTVNWVTM
jgi:hypothetical protein